VTTSLCRWLSAVVAGVIILAGAAVGRADKQDSPSLPKPGPEHAVLKHMEGSWDATAKMGSMESKATATYRLECGGLWLVSDFRSNNFGGMPFQGHGIDGYDPAKKKYVTVWVDSMSTTPMQMEGTYDPDKHVLVMIGDGPGPDGKPTKYRSVSEFKDKDHMVFTMYTGDKDGKESPMMTISYTRKGGRGKSHAE
jgi:hypothetical protein